MGEKLWKKSDVSKCHMRSKRVARTWKMMTIPITFFDTRSIVHFEFIPQSQTFNQAYYVEISKRLREIVRRKMPELWPKGLILHYDSASAQKALSLKELSGQKTYY
jgi:hypothetical protein